MCYQPKTKDWSPKEIWNPEYKLKIHGKSDSDYAMNPDDCRSISGKRIFVNNITISFRSATQKFVTLLVPEAKIAAGVMVAQDMMYIYQSLESLQLKVELPMILEMDIANSWSVSG